MVSDGRKRKLVVKALKIGDKDDYHCKTNADATKSSVLVECKDTFFSNNYNLVFLPMIGMIYKKILSFFFWFR